MFTSINKLFINIMIFILFSCSYAYTDDALVKKTEQIPKEFVEFVNDFAEKYLFTPSTHKMVIKQTDNIYRVTFTPKNKNQLGGDGYFEFKKINGYYKIIKKIIGE